jgi:hypothetical protein
MFSYAETPYGRLSLSLARAGRVLISFKAK